MLTIFHHLELLRLLKTLDERTTRMAIDLTNLTAQEQRLVADVDALLASNLATQQALAALQAQIAAGGTTDATVQAAIDAITANLATEAGKVETATAPAGATGPSAPTGATGA